MLYNLCRTERKLKIPGNEMNVKTGVKFMNATILNSSSKDGFSLTMGNDGLNIYKTTYTVCKYCFNSTVTAVSFLRLNMDNWSKMEFIAHDIYIKRAKDKESRWDKEFLLDIVNMVSGVTCYD